jgi:hypothetical protein
MNKIALALIALTLVGCPSSLASPNDAPATITGIWKFPDGNFYLCDKLVWDPKDLRFFDCKLVKGYKPDYSHGIVCVHGLCTDMKSN